MFNCTAARRNASLAWLIAILPGMAATAAAVATDAAAVATAEAEVTTDVAQVAESGPQAQAGFVVTVFHEGIGQGARHLAVRDNGDVYVARRDGILFALRDTDGDGSADLIEQRELPVSTGLEIHPPFLYFSDDASVSRIMLDDALLPSGDPETIVSDFPAQSSHASKSLALNHRGDLFVNVGAPSNACQTKPRSPGSPGLEPCPQLERQAAVWKFSATRTGQRQLDGERYITGTRNIVGMAWNHTEQALYFAMHGRDQLSTLWPGSFDDADSTEMPAEEFHKALPGADYGWPSTFVDPRTGKRLLAPEYGGDGHREAPAGRYQTPLHAYPAHWAPNDMLFYTGDQFPDSYQGGVFIAWHGSWNRAPNPQEGYRVTFQAMRDGDVQDEPIDFLTGFSGHDVLLRPSDARYRPSGLALDAQGALYVSDSVRGRIWKISHPL